MNCPHGHDVGEPPQIARCPHAGQPDCRCADTIYHWMITIGPLDKPDELHWWEEHGDL